MRLAADTDATRVDELDLLAAHLPLGGRRVLELGCGTAEKTLAIARRFAPTRLVAAEVDRIQHARHLTLDAPPDLHFECFGAEAIAAPEASFDAALMFKSLHHVPVDALDQALDELARVLRPGGHAWLSEPVFAGPYNEVLRLFHDEQQVRQAAFDAVRRAVEDGRFELVRQLFFATEVHFRDFDDFRARVIDVTHTRHRLSDPLLATVRARLEQHYGPDGIRFLQPNRVDLLRRPA
jgi:SAM-dependent methyltransferase